jgi:hypothetical protein
MDFFSMHHTQVKSGGENKQHQVEKISNVNDNKVQAGK